MGSGWRRWEETALNRLVSQRVAIIHIWSRLGHGRRFWDQNFKVRILKSASSVGFLNHSPCHLLAISVTVFPTISPLAFHAQSNSNRSGSRTGWTLQSGDRAQGTLLFVSGQIALDPASGQIIGDNDVAAQTQRAMENLGAVLSAGGADFGNVVKTTVFLADMNDFAQVNAVYSRFLMKPQPPPGPALKPPASPKMFWLRWSALR